MIMPEEQCTTSCDLVGSCGQNKEWQLGETTRRCIAYWSLEQVAKSSARGGGILSVSCNIRQQVFSSQHLSFTSISLLTCLSCRLLMHWCSHPGLTPKYQTRLQFSGLAGWVPDIKINPELRSQMSSAIKKIPAFPRYDFKCYYYSSSLQIYKKTIPNFA